MGITDRLFELQDKEYAAFQSKLTPNVPSDKFIGVRVPVVRKFAKEILNTHEAEQFLNKLPHYYYDENMLHGVLLSEIKNFDRAVELVDLFLPYVDNWAVCDIMSPKVFKKDKETLLNKIRQWASSDKTYTCRFGLEMLMSFFLDSDFRPEYLEIPASVRSEEYYVNMMVAWFFATALTKQWDSTIGIIERKELGAWCHNKTIQKACESYRITEQQKAYLRTLKV